MLLPGFGVTTFNWKVRQSDPCFRIALEMKWLQRVILLKESSNRPFVFMEIELKKAEEVSHNL